MVKLWHVFGYTTNCAHQYTAKSFISKIVAAEDEKEAILTMMLACHNDSFHTISATEFELEDGMVFDLK
jgi:hypothetical protein